MPAKVGSVKVISIGDSGVFNIGDVYSMSPNSIAKTYAGGGSFNTGDGIRVRLGESNTYAYDSDKADSNIISQ